MRAFTFFLVSLSLSLGIIISPSASWAETIHLKNGRQILAEHVREKGSHYEYDIGEDSYAIPKSIVDHIEAGGVPLNNAISGGGTARTMPELPMFAPADRLANEGDLLSKLVKDGKVDFDALSALEAKGNAELSATAEFIAGKFESEHGSIIQARRYFENALRFQADNATILIYYSALLIRSGNAAQALPYAQRAVSAAPDSADAYTMLGYAQFACDRTKEAESSWTHSLTIRPDPAVRQFLAKAQREESAENNFTQRESAHFVLHYEGRQTSEVLRGQILNALESDYDELSGSLGSPPRDNILVTIYTEQAFFDVTHAPSWSGAVNDGKLRIPISGLSSVTPELARVLKHELAHSFINQLSGGRCPTWLNEGIAQFLEPKALNNGRLLAQLFKQQRNIPLNALEGSFLRFSGDSAYLAYAESLATVSYINDTYGMGDLQRILQQLSQGMSAESALRGTIHSDYGQLESELATYLSARYGD